MSVKTWLVIIIALSLVAVTFVMRYWFKIITGAGLMLCALYFWGRLTDRYGAEE